MTFKIQDFQSLVSQKGLARQNRFEVQIPNLFASDELITLLCQSASLPGSVIEIKKQTLFGPAYIRPGNINYGETMQLSFLIDKDMSVKNIFDLWMHKVVNPSSFSVNYKENYVKDVIINQLDESEKVTLAVRLVDAFPISIGALALNQTALDRFHILPVTLSYRYWETSFINNSENVDSSGNKEWNRRSPEPSIFPEPVDATNIGAFGSAPPGSITTGGGSISNLGLGA